MASKQSSAPPESRRVAVVAGARSPFVKAGKELSDLGPLRLAVETLDGFVESRGIRRDAIDAMAFGVVVPEPGAPNLAREIVFESSLPSRIEAQTISSYCITGLRAITSVADAIACGRIEAGIAGGVESLSHATRETFNERSLGLSMGEAMEATLDDWEVSRQRQDELAFASHRKAVAAQQKRHAEDIVPVNGIDRDSGPRAGSSVEALSGLAPVFRPDGTVTAGNASPVTDGAAVVLLMSEERAREEGLTPLAYLRATEYASIDPREGLLMAPALAVPKVLQRAGLGLDQIDLIEIHEAFAAQALANVDAWERGWKAQPTGPVDWDRVNIAGGSLALGHPWSATGIRLVNALSSEMAQRDAHYGLVSVCAAGAMAGAIVLER